MFGTVTELVHLEGSPTGLDLGCDDVCYRLPGPLVASLKPYWVYARILVRDADGGTWMPGLTWNATLCISTLFLGFDLDRATVAC